MPCLEGCDTTITHYADADDFCQICWTESLSAAPSIRLGCGHVMHYHCGVYGTHLIQQANTSLTPSP